MLLHFILKYKPIVEYNIDSKPKVRLEPDKLLKSAL